MNMIPLKKSTLFLATLLMLFSATAVLADYEPVDPLPINAVTGVLPQQIPAEALQIQWTKPDITTGTGTVTGYVYEWTNSEDEPGTYTGGLGNLDNPLLNTDTSLFTGDDYDGPYWYLHIKTEYMLFASEPGISDDAYVGPFNFDDTPPTGTINLDTSVTGQTQTTSTLNPVSLSLSAATDTVKVYLSNTSTRPAVGITYATTLTHVVLDGEGSKIIYYWFEDQVGNISGRKNLSFTLIAGKSMEPAGDFEMGTGESQTFSILGKEEGETFDWEIISDPAGVASFEGLNEDVDSVTVLCDAEGTFSVQATSNNDSAVYDSGTIVVVNSTVSKTFSLITTATTNINMISFVLENTGYTKASDFLSAIPNCDTVWSWNAANQGVDSYSAGMPEFRNFNLELGKAYLVNVTQDCQFTIEGTAPDSLQISLLTTATTNLNYIALPNHLSSLSNALNLLGSIPNSDTVWKWNAQNQGLDSYSAGMPEFRNFGILWGDGFIVNVSSSGIWE